MISRLLTASLARIQVVALKLAAEIHPRSTRSADGAEVALSGATGAAFLRCQMRPHKRIIFARLWSVVDIALCWCLGESMRPPGIPRTVSAVRVE